MLSQCIFILQPNRRCAVAECNALALRVCGACGRCGSLLQQGSSEARLALAQTSVCEEITGWQINI